MAGLPDGVTIEIEFEPGTWADVTAQVAAEQTMTVRAGRPTEFDDVGPSTLNLVLRNDDGQFTPDSPGSPHYPNVIEGRRVRATVTHAGTDYPLFTGLILSWDPTYASGRLNTGTVAITAADALAALALHTFDSRWVEETRALARSAGTWVDAWVPKGDATTTAWNNIGVSVGTDYGTTTLVRAASGAGDVTYATPSSLTMEGQAEFKPSGQVGPVAVITPAGAPHVVSFWLQIPTGTLPGSGDLPESDAVVVSVRDSGGGELASLRLVDGGGTCGLTLYTGGHLTLAPAVADGAWRLVTLTASGPSTAATVTTQAGTTSTATAAGRDLTTAAVLYLGGEAADGAPARCAPMLVAGLSVAGATSVVPDLARALPGQTYAHPDLFASFQSYVPEVTSWATAGGEIRTIGEPTWTGQTALAVLQTIARTVNGVAYCPGDGAVTLAAADVVRPATPAATLDIGEDLDATSAMPTLRRAADSRPTRVTITWSGGTTTLIDTAAEANNQPRREAKLDTCAADTAGAAFAGAYVLQATNGLRITQVAVDLTTSVTDLWAVFLALYPTQRLVIGGFDPALLGSDTQVAYAQGWTTKVDHRSLVYTLDCSPASQFVSAVWDGGDEYGRWSAGDTMTITGGTAIGTTSNGTLVVTTTGTTVTLTTDPADYPLYLDWAGEKVEISAPPGSSASPQTVTTTARGVYPTAARTSHASGEPVDCWHAAVWGF